MTRNICSMPTPTSSRGIAAAIAPSSGDGLGARASGSADSPRSVRPISVQAVISPAQIAWRALSSKREIGAERLIAAIATSRRSQDRRGDAVGAFLVLADLDRVAGGADDLELLEQRRAIVMVFGVSRGSVCGISKRALAGWPERQENLAQRGAVERIAWRPRSTACGASARSRGRRDRTPRRPRARRD